MERLYFEVGGRDHLGLRKGMPRPVFLFAPGAGAPSSHPWMQRWAGLLAKIGEVEMLDYPYMLEKRGRPDSLPRLFAAHRAAMARVRSRHAGRLVLIGKSMGGRVGCHASLEEKVHAIVCLGYPLCGNGDPAKLRDDVLRQIMTPILFVQGTRDRLCPLDLLEKVRPHMRAENQLLVVPEGDHSLEVSKRHLKETGETQTQVEERVIAAVAAFIRKINR